MDNNMIVNYVSDTDNLILLVIIFGTLTLVGIGMILASLYNDTSNLGLGDLFVGAIGSLLTVILYSTPFLILFIALWWFL